MDLKFILKPEDQLFVYITGLGETVNTPMISAILIPDSSSSTTEPYTSQALDTAVQNIPCAQMIFVIQACYSGQFVSALINDANAVCKNRIVQTACGKYEIAHLEYNTPQI